MTTMRSQHPLAFAVGCLVGAVVADLLLIGGELFGHVMHWRQEWRR